VATLPAGGLKARQRALLDSLRELDRKLGGGERFHLLGHSAGGVDSQLLTSETSLANEPWAPADLGVCERIASVTTIAAPHWGTSLAQSALGRFARDPVQNWTELPSAARVLWDFVRQLPRQTVAWQVVTEAHASLPEATKFLLEFVKHRELVDDLDPVKMEALRKTHPPTRRVPLKSFVTVVPADAIASSDPFFADLYKNTSVDAPAGSPVVDECIQLLRRRSEPIIGSRSAGTLDARSSDGVVNTGRQMLDPSNPDELGGIVVGDHGDVLGHYDRQDALVPGRSLNTGVFHSGAGFGDDQFFELYSRAAQAIAQRMT
jgi:pimeloyl-ACP methyl ester carboxylesterase